MTNKEFLEKAEFTISKLCGSGKLTEEQSEKFVDYTMMPMPPIWWNGWRGIILFPIYLFQRIRFQFQRRKWEMVTGKEHLFKKGFRIRRISREQYKQIANARDFLK